MKVSKEKQISDIFFIIGAQYFAIARYSAFAGLTVCGNLYHHSIEMFLKGYLSLTIPVSNLKGFYGHNLIELWDAFKQAITDTDLISFDHIISNIDRFEYIRYPDSMIKNGMIVDITIGNFISSSADQIADGRPVYKLNVQELDELVIAIFENASLPLNAYFSFSDNELMKWLPQSFQINSDENRSIFSEI